MATNHAGKLMIIQRPDPVNAGEWLNLCGINETTFTITNAVNSEERVKCTDRAAVVETIRTYGAQDITFDANGLFDSDANGVWTADQALEHGKPNLRVFVPGFAYLECDEWLISNVTWTGGATGSLRFSANFQASGTVTKTALS
jgi:hypothetical protein